MDFEQTNVLHFLGTSWVNLLDVKGTCKAIVLNFIGPSRATTLSIGTSGSIVLDIQGTSRADQIAICINDSLGYFREFLQGKFRNFLRVFQGYRCRFTWNVYGKCEHLNNICRS